MINACVRALYHEHMSSVFRSRVIILGCLGILGWFAFLPAQQSAVLDENLTVRFLDVGQGDAIHIQTPDGYEMLIDGGATAQVLRSLAVDRRFFDRDIDVVLATHPDTDHIGGLVDVLERYRVQTILQTNAINDTPVSQAYDVSVQSENAAVVFVQRGDEILLGASTTIRVLAPAGDVSLWRSNAASVVVQVQYGEIEFLLTGDAPAGIEDYLVQAYPALIQSEILKLGHHGSDTSTSEYFLDAVRPDYAVVSAGLDNRYGHPHPDVVQRVEDRNINLVSTAQAGTITFKTDGVTVWRE